MERKYIGLEHQTDRVALHSQQHLDPDNSFEECIKNPMAHLVVAVCAHIGLNELWPYIHSWTTVGKDQTDSFGC
eukprot:566822-Pelagomonas_calceolata.AAC.4